MKKIIIAVDGHSSCGKSTLAKQLAKHFSYTFIDTGAMYRAITYYCIKNNIIKNNLIDEEKLKKNINNINIFFQLNKETNNNDIYLNGKNIELEIRKISVSQKVSLVSKIKFLRQHLVSFQQKMGENKAIVMDGRDIGTVVFPNAELKIFMTANETIRAKRRYNELIEKNIPEDFEVIKKNIINRDFEDENRKESPLKKANDAKILDNSNITKEVQLNIAIAWVNKLIKNNKNIKDCNDKNKKLTFKNYITHKPFLIAIVFIIIILIITILRFT